MRVYIAARFGRQQEMRQVRAELEAMGLEVRASWLDDPPDQVLPTEDKREFAERDVQEILTSNLVLLFTDPPSAYRGGTRHFEAGVAYMAQKETILIGPRECLHHYHLYFNRRFDTWDKALEVLFEEKRQRDDIKLRPSRSCRGDTPRDAGEGGSPSEALPGSHPNASA